MQYNVYADLPHRLGEQERAALGAALDSTVPSGGCVGPQCSDNDEVYFVVDALTLEEARERALLYMDKIIQQANLNCGYDITLQSTIRG